VITAHPRTKEFLVCSKESYKHVKQKNNEVFFTTIQWLVALKALYYLEFLVTEKVHGGMIQLR